MFGKMLLYAGVIAISYLVIYYFVMPVNLRKWQMIIHIVVSCLWAISLAISIDVMSVEYKFFLAIFYELGYIFVTIYLFADGDACRNFFLFWVLYQISNMVSSACISVLNPQFAEIFLLPDMSRACVLDFVPYYLLFIITIFLFRPVVKKVAEFTDEYIFVFRYGLAGLMIVVVGQYIVREGTNYYQAKLITIDIRALWGIIVSFILVYIVMWYKKKSMERQKQMIEQATILVGARYKHIAEENRDMRKLRHEINRHTEIVKGIKDFVTYDEINKYIEGLHERNSFFLEISLSGDIYLDSMVEKYYRLLKEQGIVLETVLEPMKLDEQTTMELICMVEEMFVFILRGIHHKKWCRFSVRMRNNMILCQMETEYDGKLEYYRRSFLDMIGDEMFVRQQLVKTKSIVNKRNGSYLYQHEKNKVILAVMVL